MKYSIILPYYDRPEFRRTLASFVQHYADRADYEVVLIEDSKNFAEAEKHQMLLDIIGEFNTRVRIKHFVDSKESFNPAHKYNFGFSEAAGDFIVLSSPEVAHESNILKGLDERFAADPDAYYVCACKAMTDNVLDMWYQHSQMRNMLFHFCSAMSRASYILVSGFDEKYCDGIGFEDESFVQRVKAARIKIVPVDELISVHNAHERAYIGNHPELIEVNRKLFLSQVQQ